MDSMRRSDSGAGRLKPIVVLIILIAVIYAGIQIIPVYVNNYELRDYIQQLAIQATVERTQAEKVQDAVLAKARSLSLPITRDNIKVTVGSRVTINVDYLVPIDLKVYTLMLHFTPSAENSQI